MIDRLITRPASEPVSTSVLREWLRDAPDSDASLERLITAAREYFEKSTNLIIVTQTRLAVFDAWPLDPQTDDWSSGQGSILALQQGFVTVPQGPLISVDHIKTLGADGASLTAFAAASYYAEVGSKPGRINLLPGALWPVPGVSRAGIQIQYKAGIAPQAEDAPSDIVQAILQMAAHWYENREIMTDGQTVAQIPVGAERIIARHRVSPGL